MALAEGERRLGLTRTFPGIETGVKTPEIKPTRYSEKEISRMMVAPPPPELTAERSIQTPVGTWSKDGDIAVFDPKLEAETAEITKISARRKLATIITRILNIS